ncbi:hypothetical protein OIU79_017007 [Salix purpurea]|uniref:DUF241 domain protein n=1 Tax=Salix purpurea TaxID=77065 RepID=A0A9Q0WTW4_SALPP|nr:hypothetical protein OIU79_017007 [Salix purpurea]
MAACHVRSISLPSRSHPLNASVEDQLDRLRSSLTASTSAYHKLSGLKALYECVEDFLQLPSTQQTLSSEQQKERGEEVLNGSLLLLDMCSTTRDVFSSMKECLQELESSLRRRKGGESGFSSEVESYMMSRKKIEKTIRRCFKNLKSTEKNIASAVDAVSMLREVRETSLEIFQSLLSFVSQAKARSSSHGWSVVSKLFQSKRVSCEAEASELEKIDAELLVLKSSKDINPVQVQNVLKGLVALESDIQVGRGGVGGFLQETTENQSYHPQYSQPLVDVLLKKGQLCFHCPSIQFCNSCKYIDIIKCTKINYEYNTIQQQLSENMLHPTLLLNILS